MSVNMMAASRRPAPSGSTLVDTPPERIVLDLDATDDHKPLLRPSVGEHQILTPDMLRKRRSATGRAPLNATVREQPVVVGQIRPARDACWPRILSCTSGARYPDVIDGEFPAFQHNLACEVPTR